MQNFSVLERIYRQKREFDFGQIQSSLQRRKSEKITDEVFTLFLPVIANEMKQSTQNILLRLLPRSHRDAVAKGTHDKVGQMPSEANDKFFIYISLFSIFLLYLRYPLNPKRFRLYRF